MWARYTEAELTGGNLEAAKALFMRCLLSCPSVDLHHQYLRHGRGGAWGAGRAACALLVCAAGHAGAPAALWWWWWWLRQAAPPTARPPPPPHTHTGL